MVMLYLFVKFITVALFTHLTCRPRP